MPVARDVSSSLSAGVDHDGEERRALRPVAGAHRDWSYGNPDDTGDLFVIAEQVETGRDPLDKAWWFSSVAPLPQSLRRASCCRSARCRSR